MFILCASAVVCWAAAGGGGGGPVWLKAKHLSVKRLPVPQAYSNHFKSLRDFIEEIVVGKKQLWCLLWVLIIWVLCCLHLPPTHLYIFLSFRLYDTLRVETLLHLGYIKLSLERRKQEKKKLLKAKFGVKNMLCLDYPFQYSACLWSSVVLPRSTFNL